MHGETDRSMRQYLKAVHMIKRTEETNRITERTKRNERRNGEGARACRPTSCVIDLSGSTSLVTDQTSMEGET